MPLRTLPLECCCALNPEPKLRRGDDAAQTSTKLYLILDFVNGGHLFFQLYRQVRGLGDESRRSLGSRTGPEAIWHASCAVTTHRAR